MCPTWKRQFTWVVLWMMHSVFPEFFSALTLGNHEAASLCFMQTLPWYSVLAMNSRHVGLTHEIMFFSQIVFLYTLPMTHNLINRRQELYSWCHYLSGGVEAKYKFYIIYYLNREQNCCLFHLFFDQGEKNLRKLAEEREL